jgi:hypothetical protein
MKKSVATPLSGGVGDGIAVSVQNLAIFVWGLALIARGSNGTGIDTREDDSGTLFVVKHFHIR